MMESDKRGFDDYVYSGMDSFLKFTAKAFDSLKTVNDQAIEKIDLVRLEKRAQSRYALLGRAVYRPLAEGITPDLSDPEIISLMHDIEKITEEIAKRRTDATFGAEKETSGEKNEKGY
jgi:hypothetical protein